MSETKTIKEKAVKAVDNKSSESAQAEKIIVKLIRSRIGCTQRELATLRGLGLKRINSTKELEATPAVQGMIAKVSRIVSVVS